MENLKTPKWLKLIDDGKANFKLRFNSDILEFRAAQKKDLQSFQPEIFEGLKPKPEDYLQVKFRAISARYLGESGHFLDFSNPGVLQNSIPLMLPKKLGGQRRTFLMFHRNHDNSIEARIGFINNAEWAQAGGEQSAPGINIDVMIDWKLAPHEARQLLSEPPLVDSVSISFLGEYEKSHPDLDGWDFWALLGHEIDGDVVRIIVTKILAYDHVGLVTEGADEEADKIDQNNADPAGWRIPDKIANPLQSKNNGGTQMTFQLSEQHLKSLAQLLDLNEPYEPDDLINSVETLLQSNEELRKARKQDAEKAKKLAELLASRREQVIAQLIKLEGEETKGTQVIINKMDFEELAALEEEYRIKLDKKYPFKCQKCGSGNVERRSSQEEPPVEPKKPAGKSVDHTQYQVH